jgi:alcohol dehydrogenase
VPNRVICRSLLLTAPGRLEWQTEHLAPPAPHEVRVRTLYGAVSIGTELPLYRGAARSSSEPRYPFMTGYESYGVIEAVGEGVRGLQAGDRVVSFYGHRTHALVAPEHLIPVPEGLEPRVALLAILSCDAKKGILKVSPRQDEPVLVTGAGTIGLLTIFVLKALGIETVDVLEPLPYRQALARKLGARQVLSPGASPGSTYATGFECSSDNDAFHVLQERLEPHGRICILADGNLEPFVLTPHFHEKELRVVGSSDGLDYQEHAKWFFGLTGLEKLIELFDTHISAQALPDVFERMARRQASPVKILVNYSMAATRDR